MNKDEIASLANDISVNGLIHPPLVRVVDDGGYQILSGHRRVLAYKQLASEDKQWEQIPVRVAYGVSDEDAELVLDSGNIQRSLTREEKRAQYERIGKKIKELRKQRSEWRGVRTDDILATIMGMSTNSFKRMKHIEMDLIDELFAYYEQDILNPGRAYRLALQTPEYQKEVAQYLAKKKPKDQVECSQLIDEFMKGALDYLNEAYEYIVKADASLFMAREIMRTQKRPVPEELERLEAMKDKICQILGE